MMDERSPAQRAADQRAFEAGQAAFRAGKSFNEDNPDSPESPYCGLWEQGWRDEHDIHYK